MKKINQELFIAILDDDPDFAYVLSRMIVKVLGAGKVQVHIQTFRTTQEADTSPLSFDLLFLDVELGNENGIQWVKKWRKTRKFQDIIMDNEEPIVVRNHINELQHTLEKYGFVRVQVSYLVNVKFIERFDGKNVYLRNGIKKFVSPRFEKQLLEKLRSYMDSDGDDLNGDTG